RFGRSLHSRRETAHRTSALRPKTRRSGRSRTHDRCLEGGRPVTTRSAEIVAPTTATDLDAIGDAIGRLAPLPPERTRTREVLHAAIEALRVTTDDVAAQAIDVVATELADVADRLS